MLTSSGTDFTGNDVTDDVIITKINRVLPYPTRNNPVKFHQDRIRFSRVIVFTSSGGDFTGNDVIVTKTNGVLPYPLRNNPVKFHQDRTRFSRVIKFTSSGGLAGICYAATQNKLRSSLFVYYKFCQTTHN